MILFLDSTSSLPEFSLIEDNKIIFSKKILTNNLDKISDCIVPVYLDIEKKYNLYTKLKLLIVNTGPGSYTSLRVSIAFLSGLSIAKKIQIIGISSCNLFRYSIPNEKLPLSAIFLNSSNNQNYFCTYSKKNDHFIINKIDNYKEIFFDKCIKIIYLNSELLIPNLKLNKTIEFKKLSFKKLIISNLQNIISLPKKELIEPIYISNNKILN